jgi:hypothetical protein
MSCIVSESLRGFARSNKLDVCVIRLEKEGEDIVVAVDAGM